MAKVKNVRMHEIFHQLHATAKQSERARFLKLGSGIRLGICVRDGITTVLILRQWFAITPTDELLCRVNCQFPPYVERSPRIGQRELRDRNGKLWHQIAFRWREQ